MVYECGDLLAETERFPDGPRRSVADVDLDRIRQERMRQGTFDDNRRTPRPSTRASARSSSTLDPPTGDIGLRRKVDRFPFVPDDVERLALDCYEAYNIQVSGLEQRLRAIGQPKVVIGVSGGLDSTHALIVAAKAMDRLGRPRSDILAFTLPGFATGETTKSYATRLSKALGVTFEELDIRPAAKQMLTDMGHPFARGEEVYDVTFENVQAGLRTDYLFRIANQRGGIVLGTGDLSELALGWCTYGVGDQMSHYTVNSGVPKTLIQHLIRWVVDSEQLGETDDEVNQLLTEIVGQEITPELIPTREGEKPQATEGIDRSLRAARLHPLPRAALRLPAEQDRVPRRARLVRRDDGGVAARTTPRTTVRSTTWPTIRALARGVHQAVLRQPVQAVGAAQRPQGERRRHDVAARRLADAERRQPGGLAGRARERPARLSMSRRVLVVQHQDDCPPAWSASGWSRPAARSTYAVRTPVTTLPDDLAGHDAFLVLGGSMGANDDDDHPWLAPTKELVRDAAAASYADPGHLPGPPAGRPWPWAVRRAATRAASSSGCCRWAGPTRPARTT